MVYRTTYHRMDVIQRAELGGVLKETRLNALPQSQSIYKHHSWTAGYRRKRRRRGMASSTTGHGQHGQDAPELWQQAKCSRCWQP